MMRWLGGLKRLSRDYPPLITVLIIYSVLTGLRPNEACQSIDLIHKDFDNYFNYDKSMLVHFKYPEIFIRRTKKAYISIASRLVSDIANQCGKTDYSALKTMIRRKSIGMNIAFCRKIFATYMRKGGMEPEVIDLLQGRIPKSVFVRNYYKPTLDLKTIDRYLLSLYDSDGALMTPNYQVLISLVILLDLIKDKRTILSAAY